MRSYNTLYVQLMQRVGPKAAMEMATRMGIRTPLRPVLSAVLGSNEVTAMDMAGAYSTFANRGIRVSPVLVTRITRADGTVLFNHEHRQTKVLEAGIVDTVTSILEQVIQRGTGTRAKLDRPAAGKTGTTDDNKDAWFAGYTNELATAVWVGFPQVGADGKVIPMRSPNTSFAVTGGSYPAEIWQHFMSAVLAGRPATPFPAPTTTTTIPRFVEPPDPSGVGPMTGLPDVRGLPVDAGHHDPAGGRLPRGHPPRPRRRWEARHRRGPEPATRASPRDSMVTLEVAPKVDSPSPG